MGIGSLFESRSTLLSSPINNFLELIGVTKSGVNVNENSALSLSPVWAAVMLISNTMALFPLPVYKRVTGRFVERAPEHALYDLIHDAPNPETTSFDWRQTMMMRKLLWGAGISEIEFSSNGHPVALWPLETYTVQPMRTQSHKLVYHVSDHKGTRILYPHQLLIFRFAPEINGGWKSPVQVHRETLGAAMAVKTFGMKTFTKGTHPTGILSGLPKAPTEAARLSLQKEISEAYGGLDNAHGIMMLEAGVKFERIGLPPQDAQYLDTRIFDVTEVSRIYNVSPVLLHELTKTTSWGSGIDSLMRGFIKTTMLSHCTKWEQQFNSKLITPYTKDYFCKFVMEGLLRGDPKDRAFFYRMMLDRGAMTINEVREREELAPVEGGDEHFIPLNMQTLKKAIKGNKEGAEG